MGYGRREVNIKGAEPAERHLFVAYQVLSAADARHVVVMTDGHDQEGSRRFGADPFEEGVGANVWIGVPPFRCIAHPGHRRTGRLDGQPLHV